MGEDEVEDSGKRRRNRFAGMDWDESDIKFKKTYT